MNMRVTGSYPAGLTSPVDKRIGDAFPVVNEVYKHLTELIYLANNADKLTARQIQLRSNLQNKSIEWSYAGNEWMLLCTFDELIQVDGIRALESKIIDYLNDAGISASAAAASASTASTKAGEASSSAASALASSDNANNKYKLFDERYLGSKTADPTTDNYRQPLLVGAEYWNSTANVRKVWSGAEWVSENVTDLAALTAALNTKAPINNPTFTGIVSGVTKAMVGLEDVDNTSDLAKPISSATQAALDGKAAATHTHDGALLIDNRLNEFAGDTAAQEQAQANLGLGVADLLAYYILAKS